MLKVRDVRHSQSAGYDKMAIKSNISKPMVMGERQLNMITVGKYTRYNRHDLNDI